MLVRAGTRGLSTGWARAAQAAATHTSGWSYVCGPGSPPLLGTTIGQAVDRAAAKFGEREGLVVTHQAGLRWTFAQLREDIDRLAAGLLELGLRPGDRLGIWGPNNYEWFITQFAAAKV